MVKRMLLISLTASMFVACNDGKKEQPAQPQTEEAGAIFLKPFDTPYGEPPFDKIKQEDYAPALQKGIELHQQEIDAIANSKEEPTFENTIAALDYSGDVLGRVEPIFYGITGTDRNDYLDKVSEEILPKLDEHWNGIYLNKALFDRIKKIYDNKAALNLSTEQTQLLEEYYKAFTRGGIMLDDAKKKELTDINKQLNELSIKFGKNMLDETNAFKLVLDKKEDLAGLPQSVIDAAADAAKEDGQEGKWVFGLQKPSWIPFLQYSDRRDLREKLYKAMYNRGNNNNDKDNKEIINKIVNLRIKKANILGYKTHADYVLEESMAKTPAAAKELLMKVWKYALPQAKKELAELQAIANKEGAKFKIESWDWWYYAEKLRKQKYAIDEEQFRPYFKMENVREGVFYTANKLYGLNFEKLDNVAKYNPEVEVYKVTDKDGNLVCLFYTDYFPRASKNGGAWMSDFRGQRIVNGKNIRPIIYNVGNFTKPTSNAPSLLTTDDVSTMFHEFGHAIHGMLSNVTYPSVSGTNVPRDFVEMPSQVMENWAFQPEVMKVYAKHYQTGELIPDALVKKLKESQYFNKGFETTELIAASLLDMDWHTQTVEQKFDVADFEAKSMAKIGLIKEIIPRYKSTYFSHIFDGGYSAGYYSYTWAEVLDADVFNQFETNGIFDPATAASFRDNILSKGSSDDLMKLYVQFRGKQPDPKYLLIRRGFIKK